METPEDVVGFRLVAGNLALDFVNTDPGSSPESEVLRGYDDLVAWGRHAGLLTEPEARRLLRRARRGPGEAREAFQRALRVRGYLYELFQAVAAGRPPPGRCVVALRGDEAEALARAELVAADGGFRWSWARDEDLARPLRQVVHAAVELLTAEPGRRADHLRRVKRCGGCPWLFVDESKNRSRRWCSMDNCGTDEKVRRYVARRAAARRAHAR
jgi:predicted RNA-binding Zn ribbon-like protein